MLVRARQITRGPFYATMRGRRLSGLGGYTEAVYPTIKSFWDWFDSTRAGAIIAAPLNSVIYPGYGSPKVGPAPGVPSGATTGTYSPTEQELIQAQKDKMAEWTKTAFDNTLPSWAGDKGSGSGSGSWIMPAIAIGLAVWVLKR